MGESQQVRLQSDIVSEIKKHEGGSFSEKFRNWKNKELQSNGKNNSGSDISLTDIRSAVESALEDNLNKKALKK